MPKKVITTSYQCVICKEMFSAKHGAATCELIHNNILKSKFVYFTDFTTDNDVRGKIVRIQDNRALVETETSERIWVAIKDLRRLSWEFK